MQSNKAHGLTEIGGLWIRFENVDVINFDLADIEENVGFESEIKFVNGEAWLIDEEDTAILKRHLKEEAEANLGRY